MQVIYLKNSSKLKIYMQLENNVLAIKLELNRIAISKIANHTSILQLKTLVLLL